MIGWRRRYGCGRRVILADGPCSSVNETTNWCFPIAKRLKSRSSITPEGDATAAVEQMAALSAQGIRLRTRALITTMAARLLLGDLFIHGIGGAKYDQLTDRIIAQFFGFEPPGYMVVSGTLQLPISRPAVATESVQQLRQRIRELEFHPERFIEESGGSWK